jgi:hypothetical protein
MPRDNAIVQAVGRGCGRATLTDALNFMLLRLLTTLMCSCWILREAVSCVQRVELGCRLGEEERKGVAQWISLNILVCAARALTSVIHTICLSKI